MELLTIFGTRFKDGYIRLTAPDAPDSLGEVVIPIQKFIKSDPDYPRTIDDLYVGFTISTLQPYERESANVAVLHHALLTTGLLKGTYSCGNQITVRWKSR